MNDALIANASSNKADRWHGDGDGYGRGGKGYEGGNGRGGSYGDGNGRGSSRESALEESRDD